MKYSLCDKIPNIFCMDFFSTKKEWIHFPRRTSEYILYVIKNGDMYIKEDNIEYELHEGDVILLEPNKFHVGTKPAFCEYYFIHFDNIAMQNSPPKNEEYLVFSKHFNMSDTKSLMRILSILDDYTKNKEKFYGIQNHYNSIIASQIFIEITRHLTGSNVIRNDNYNLENRIITYLNFAYREKITGVVLEKEFNLNFDYMNRIFKKVNGNTIFVYLKRLRITRAKQLLEMTDMKCYEVADLTGFSNEYYFNKIFKQEVGCSPAKYRNK